MCPINMRLIRNHMIQIPINYEVHQKLCETHSHQYDANTQSCETHTPSYETRHMTNFKPFPATLCQYAYNRLNACAVPTSLHIPIHKHMRPLSYLMTSISIHIRSWHTLMIPTPSYVRLITNIWWQCPSKCVPSILMPLWPILNYMMPTVYWAIIKVHLNLCQTHSH